MSESNYPNSFKLIFEHSPIPLWEIDYTGLFQYFDTLKQKGVEDFHLFLEKNPSEYETCVSLRKIMQVNYAVLKMHETISVENFILNYTTFLSEKGEDALKEEFNHLFQGHNFFAIQSEIITRSIIAKTIQLKINILQNEDPEKVTGIVSTEDISDLKIQEKQFEQMISNSPDSITLSRVSDGKFVFMNETFRQESGFSDEELKAKSAYELGMWVNNADRDIYFAKLKENGSIDNLPTSFRDKNGQVREALVSAKLVDYLGEPHIIVNGKDVTESNKLTKALRKSEEQFRKAFMNIPDAFQINKVSDATFVDVNDIFLKYTGYTREELIGKTPEDLNIWVNNVTNRSFYRRLRKDNYISNFETTFRMKDGRLLRAFISASIINLNGEPHIITITKDISDYKEAQDALAASEEKFQNIFSKSPDGLAIMEMENWTYLEVNEAFTKISGLPYEEIIGKSTFELNLWARESDRAYITSKVSKREEIINHESLFSLSNGEQIHMLVSAKLIEIQGQQRYLLIAKNIDDFVKVQKSLFEKENRYKAIVSNSYEGIAIIDHEFHFDYINDQMELLTGYAANELIGFDFRKILTEKSEVLATERYIDRQAGKKVIQNYPLQIIRKNGEIRTVEIHSSVIKTAEGKSQTIVQLLDVTDREKAAKIIAKEHSRAMQYFEVAGMMMVALDTKGNVTAVNKKGCEVLEASEKEIVGKNWFSNFVPKNFRDSLGTRFLKSMVDEKYHDSYFENTIKTSLGKEKIIAWQNSLLKDENEKTIGTISSGEDITDKEEVSRILNMSGMVAILWKNEKDSPIEFVSENAENLFGYSAQDFYSKKIDYLQFIHPDDADRLRQETLELTDQNRSHFNHKPYRIITKTGETKWVNDRTTVQYDSEGNISYYYGILSDITEDIVKGEKLRQSKEILAQMNDGVIVCSFTGEIYEWSGGAEKIFGYELEEIEGKNVQVLWTTNIKADEKIAEIINDIELLGFFQKEISCIHKTKRTIPIELTAKILYDSANNPLSLILVNRDITNRKIAQNALMESEKRYRHIFESILDGVIIYNLNKEIVQVNNMATQMYGYTYLEFTQNISSRYIHPVENHSFEDVINHLDFDYDRMFEGESIDTTKSGKRFFVNAKGRLIDYNNEPHLLIIVRDITKIKQGELDLLKAKEKAIESEQLKSAFLANMSHEIRTPMNSIIGFSDLLADDEISSEEKNHFLQIIRKNGNQLMSIINDIIDISKIEAGQIQLNYENTNLCETFQDIYNMFEINMKSKGLELIKKSKHLDNKFVIKTDELRLKQILINLISNSMKFTHTGFIEFGCNVIDDEKSLHFYVKDSGIGISKDKQKDIFQRFMQAELKTTKLYGGTGLGLAISQGLTQTFKGRMWLESEEGTGSTFNFSIPLIRD